MIVMTTNTAYEDDSNPMHTIGPITGEQPGSQSYVNNEMPPSTTSTEKSQDTTEKERKTGTWAAGTGRLFDPERWLRSDGTFDPNAGPSLPFSLGQRGCFGKSLAVSSLTPG
jgi:hypothetical protein